MDKNLHNIDQLFKDGIEGHTDQPNDLVWNQLDQQLDKQQIIQSGKKYLLLKRTMLALAALLAITLVLLYKQYNQPKQLSNATDTATISSNPSSKRQQQPANQEDGHTLTTNQKQEEQKVANPITVPKGQENSSEQSVTTADQSNQQKIVPLSKESITENELNVQGVTIKKETNTFGKQEEKKTSNLLLKPITPKKPYQKNLAVQQQALQVNEGNQLEMQIEPNATSTRVAIPSTSTISYTTAALVQQLQPSMIVTGVPNTVNTSLALVRAGSPIQLKKSSFKPGFTVSAFYTPEFISNHVETGEHVHREDDKEAIEKGESIKYAGSFGVQVQYQINQHWSVLTGIQYSKTTSALMPRNLYARPEHRPGNQQGAGDLKFKLNCTAGYVFISPKSGSAPLFGDSIQAFQSTNTLEYVTIPVGMNYRIQKGKFSFNGLAAFNINVLTRGQVDATIAEQSSVKTLNNVKIEGIKPVYYSGSIGLGVEYAINDRLSLFTLPVKNFSLTSINKGTPADTRRAGVGLQTGIRFRL